MPKIVWDNTGEKTFQTGVSNGVVYLEDGRAVPWNGLISVSVGGTSTPTAVYYDGKKVSNKATSADFAGKITAYTFPDELLELQGYGRLMLGAYVGEQDPMPFHLSYQTRVGNDLGDDYYKIHVLYNVTATPEETEYATMAEDQTAIEFGWAISTVPMDIDGYKPSSYLILDSRYLPPTILEQIELLLYGGNTADPAFPEFNYLISLLKDYYIIEIVDTKDGKFQAIAKVADDIDVETDQSFTVTNIDATYIDPETYNASSTRP